MGRWQTGLKCICLCRGACTISFDSGRFRGGIVFEARPEVVGYGKDGQYGNVDLVYFCSPNSIASGIGGRREGRGGVGGPGESGVSLVICCRVATTMSCTNCFRFETRLPEVNQVQRDPSGALGSFSWKTGAILSRISSAPKDPSALSCFLRLAVLQCMGLTPTSSMLRLIFPISS
jgi:hypothetical protein